MGKIKQHRHQPSTLHGHVHELLMRLIVVVVSLLVVGTVVYFFYEPALTFLGAPLRDTLYYSNPAGGFNYVMKICLMGGLVISVPVLAYNAIMFVRPALPKFVSMKKILLTVGASSALALAGAMFAFYIIVPESLSFFKGYQVSGLKSLISADSYFNFVTGIMTMFALIFQIPLVISFIDHIKPSNIGKLLKADKYVVVGSLILTLLQPFTYDLMTSLLIAFSMIAIYNLAIIVVAFQHLSYRRMAQNAVRATIVRPALAQDLILDNQIINAFAEDLMNLENYIPKQQIITPIRNSMDVKPLGMKQSAPVKPAAWVEERRLQRIAINTRAQSAFSDVIRIQRVSPASA